MPSSDDVEVESLDFEEERTSPEVLRTPRVRSSTDTGDADPIAIVAVSDGLTRNNLTTLLCADGWNALPAGHAEELVTLSRRFQPEIVIVDTAMQIGEGMSVPEAVHATKHESYTRVIGLIHVTSAPVTSLHASPQAANSAGAPSTRTASAGSVGKGVAAAVADGYDDFIVHSNNDVEVLARATANLKSARLRKDILKQRRDAASLLQLVQALASSTDVGTILHNVSRLVADVMGFERCSVVLIDPDNDEAMMVAASEDKSVKDLRIKISRYPEVQRCIEDASPILITDATTDPTLAPVHVTIAEKGIRSMALFPVLFENQVAGVLFLRSTRGSRSVADADVNFGQIVASTCAVAIRNARLYHQFRATAQDISAMRAQAERQTEALHRYQDFLEYAADGMAIIGVDGRLLYINKEGRRLFGRVREEMIDARFDAFILDESRERWRDVVDQVKHGKFKRSFDVYTSRADGQERVFSLSAGSGGPDAGLIIVSFRDVTETREMEGELRTTKEFLENLIDNSVDAIVAADMNGNIMLFNKGAERLYGYKAADVIGKMHVSQLHPTGVASDVMMKLRDERWGGRGRLEAQRREIVTAAADVVPVSMTASLIYEDGEEVATVGVYADLRDRMAIERQLSEARDQLTKTEKARVAAELAGMAAHELNQPLTSVLGYADMLKNRIAETDARLRRPVDTIFKQAERMAEIVRKIGRITKYETTRYGLNTDMIDLDRASASSDGSGSPPAGGPPLEDSFPPSIPVLSLEHGNAEQTGSEPTSEKAFLRTLASVPGKSTMPFGGPQDPRAAVVRMDTVDNAPPGYERRLREQEKQLARHKLSGQGAEHAGAQSPSPAAGGPHTVGANSSRAAPLASPLPRSVMVGGIPEIPDDGDSYGETNPGVRLSDLKKS